MTPKAIADRLESAVGIDGGPRPLASVIEDELIRHFGLLAIHASELAEKVTPAVARIIASRATQAEQAGTIAALVLLGTTSDIIAGCCHILPLDAAMVAVAKRQRLHAGALLAAMRALTFNEFERFGARVLAEIGAGVYRITPHGGDQGIDFYGRLSLGEFQEFPAPFMKLAHDVVLLFAGQAKHYPNGSLGPDVVRELVGAVSLARTKSFSKTGIDIFHDFDLKPFSPLVTLLFTTGRISRGAALLAESAGIIARSGEQLAVFLADKRIGIKGTEGGDVFDRLKFMQWLDDAEEPMSA
jgi:hypothetical protein